MVAMVGHSVKVYVRRKRKEGEERERGRKWEEGKRGGGIENEPSRVFCFGPPFIRTREDERLGE
jgi:hypothetical protein